MTLSTVHAFPGCAFAVVWESRIFCTSHTTWGLLALFPEVTNLLAVCVLCVYGTLLMHIHGLWSLVCVVSVLSSCGFVLSIVIGIIRDFFFWCVFGWIGCLWRYRMWWLICCEWWGGGG